jgi:hypothetical protein
MSKKADSGKGGKPKPKRQARLWFTGLNWCLTLTEWHATASATDTHYLTAKLPSDYGLSLALVKVTDGADRPTYHVLLNADAPSCDCKGFERWGRCKHLSALLALQAEGKLDALPAPTAPKPPAKPAPSPAATSWGDDL